MGRRRGYARVLALLAAASACPVHLRAQACPLVSHVRTGPGGLLGATLNYPEPAIDDYGQLYPEDLVILRGERLLRRFPRSAGMTWNWVFWHGGKEVVVDRSPLHFTEQYQLLDLATGRTVAEYARPGDKGPEPEWVKALDAADADEGHANPAALKPTGDCRFRPARSSRGGSG